MTTWLTPDRIVLSLLQEADHRVILKALKSIPLWWDMAKSEPEFVREADLRFARKLAHAVFVLSKNGEGGPELAKPLRRIAKCLRPHENKIHDLLLSGDLRAKGTPIRRSEAKKLDAGLWQNLRIDFNKSRAEEDARVEFKGIMISKVAGLAWPPGSNIGAPVQAKRARGRPTSRAVYKAEFGRWCVGKKVRPKLSENVHLLQDWYVRVHGEEGKLADKSVAKHITKAWSKYKKTQK
ncbi:MAG: hypothetical protein VW600_02495 [Ferrovibrio sp.]